MLRNTYKAGLTFLAVISLSISAAAFAESRVDNVHDKLAGVPVPKFKITKGEKCVEPTDVMREQHMEFILHQRDETVHRGIRTSKYSLQKCVSCHADPVTKKVTGKEGFCESCHAYAAVSIDCFSCHTDKATDKKSVRTGIGAIGSKVIAEIGGVK